MSKEKIILLAAWILTTAMLFVFVPRKKTREAFLIFFSIQFMTWCVGLIIVEFGLIEYPVRLFPYANKTSFTFEYYVYPAICVIFNLHYPVGRKILRQFFHYFYFCSVMTLIEVACEKYTDIVNYTGWTWYLTWITLFISFYVSREFYLWFFRLKKKNPART